MVNLKPAKPFLIMALCIFKKWLNSFEDHESGILYNCELWRLTNQEQDQPPTIYYPWPYTLTGFLPLFPSTIVPLCYSSFSYGSTLHLLLWRDSRISISSPLITSQPCLLSPCFLPLSDSSANQPHFTCIHLLFTISPPSPFLFWLLDIHSFRIDENPCPTTLTIHFPLLLCSLFHYSSICCLTRILVFLPSPGWDAAKERSTTKLQQKCVTFRNRHFNALNILRIMHIRIQDTTSWGEPLH